MMISKQEPQTSISKQYLSQALVAETEERVNRVVVETANTASLSMRKLIKLSSEDKTIQNLKHLIKHNHRIPLTAELKSYRSIASELSISEDGLVLKEDKIVLPESLWKEVIDLAHRGHMGTKMCVKLIKENYYFPNIDKLVSTKAGEYVLVIICEHSRYPILKLARNMTSKEVVRLLKLVFIEFGCPQAIKSDNGPAFKSAEFSNFCFVNKVAHCKVTPLWPRANGMCERFMRNLNKVIRCSQVSKENWKTSLTSYLKNYRATPHSSTGVTPNQLMSLENENGIPSDNKSSNKDYKQIAFNLDKEAKSNQKHYADIYLATKTIQFKKNDVVKLKWDRKHSKYLPLLDTENYLVLDVNGTMITAQKDGSKPITRNSSFFKLATAGKIPNQFFEQAKDNYNMLQHLSDEDQFQIFEPANQVADIDDSADDDDDLSSSSNDEYEQTFMDYIDNVVADYYSSDDSSFMSPSRDPISEEYTTDTSASNDSDDTDQRRNTSNRWSTINTFVKPINKCILTA